MQQEKKQQSKQRVQAGFTLIELMIVTALMVVLSLTVSAMFMTFMVTNARTNTKNTLKIEGSYALAQMEFMLRNSYQLVENSSAQVCQSDADSVAMDSIAVESIDGGITEFSIETDGTVNKIASNSGNFLTSDAVTVVTDSLKFNCTESYNGVRSVKIDFDLSKVVPSVTNTTNEESTQHFTTVVSLRN